MRARILLAFIILFVGRAASGATTYTLGKFTITDDPTTGVLNVDGPMQKLRFGYKTDPSTWDSQSGGNIYWWETPLAPGANLVAVYEWPLPDPDPPCPLPPSKVPPSGCSRAYAAGAGGIGATTMYAAIDPTPCYGNYSCSLADNGLDATTLVPPGCVPPPGGEACVTLNFDGSLQVRFLFDVASAPACSGTGLSWYEIEKTWTIAESGRIRLEQDWYIKRTGWISEPMTRNHFAKLHDMLTRVGSPWWEGPPYNCQRPAGPPGSNSRRNACNQPYDWSPDPCDFWGECGELGMQQYGFNLDAVHSELVRFTGGPTFDIVWWPDADGLGFENLGLYAFGYARRLADDGTYHSGSEGGPTFEICHHNRLVGDLNPPPTPADGAHDISLNITAWWGGGSATPGRFRNVTAPQRWTDTFEFEARPPAWTSPTENDFLVGGGHGPGIANRVRIADGGGVPGVADVIAYGALSWGTNVATGDLDGDGWAEALTGPGPGPTLGPQVRSFDSYGAFLAKINFFAYGTLRFGVNVTAQGTDSDAYREIQTGAGPGAVFGPHVRGWEYDNSGITANAKVNFFAYSTLKWGVYVEGTDVDVDTFDELLTAPGPGQPFAAQIRAWNVDGGAVSAVAKINFNAFAGGYGGKVAGGDVDPDAFGEIVAGTGPGPGVGSRVRGFDYDGGSVAPLPNFDSQFSSVYGISVAAADLTLDGWADVVVGAGPDPATDARVSTFTYAPGTLSPLPATFLAFSGNYGVSVAAGRFGI